MDRQESSVENVTWETAFSLWMSQLSCDTPGAVPTSAVYTGESPDAVDAQVVIERSLLPCLVQAFSRRWGPLPNQDWGRARANVPVVSQLCALQTLGSQIRNPVWTRMHVRGAPIGLVMGWFLNQEVFLLI
jgi:hypothetical protein